MFTFDRKRLLREFAASLICIALLTAGCSETVLESPKFKAPAFANATKTLASESSIADHPFVRIAANGPAGDRRRALAVKPKREIQTNDLLTWAESAFPDLFPGNQAQPIAYGRATCRAWSFKSLQRLGLNGHRAICRSSTTRTSNLRAVSGRYRRSRIQGVRGLA